MAGVDTVGGVRVPAGFCGVVGFRPSYGAISKIGVLPVSASLDTVGMWGPHFGDSLVYDSAYYFCPG